MDNTSVLVVDYEERIRSSLRGILSDEGFRVLDTDGGPAVMDIIEREHPELVLLDVWMPKLDGIELLRRIKAEQPATHVIMISGHANIQNAVAATRLGAGDFIEKPFSVDALLTASERVLAGETGGTTAPGIGDASAVTNGRAGRSASSTPSQFTVKSPLVMAGPGRHLGLKRGVVLPPAPPPRKRHRDWLQHDPQPRRLYDPHGRASDVGAAWFWRDQLDR